VRCILGYAMLGLASLGLLLGVAGDVADAVRGEPLPVEVRLQRVLDRATSGRSAFPGAALHVESPQTGVWQGASGLSSVAPDEQMSISDQFAIGSITKTYIAHVVLQLMEEGLVDLDAPITSYLPEDMSTRFADAEAISVRMLLNHTSGIPEWLTDDVMGRLANDVTYVWSVDELLGIASNQEPYFEPGGGFFYSNTDYTLLGVIIEQVTGQSWESQIQRRILKPLGLDETVVRVPGDVSPVPGMARGYSGMGRDLIDLSSADPSMAGAAGGNAMVATVSDLGLFLGSVLDGSLFSGPETLAEMLDWVDAPDEQGIPYWYGLGIERYQIDGVDLIGHGGGAVGYSTVMYKAPDLETTIVASTNLYGLGAAYMDLMLPALKELHR